MNARESSDRAELAVHLARTPRGKRMWPSRIAATVAELYRLAKRYHRMCEVACEREQTKQELAAEARIEARIRDAVEPFRLAVTFQGDPRGYCVKVQIPGASNTWGNGGWGIG